MKDSAADKALISGFKKPKKWNLTNGGPWLVIAGAIFLYAISFIFGGYILLTDPSENRGATVAGGMSASAIVFSAVLAGLMALRTISNQRQVSRQNLTTELLLRRIWDRDYIDARKLFIRARRSREGITYWGDRCHEHTDTTAAIRDILNDYELTAIAISNGVVDEDIYKRLTQTTLMLDYQASREHISVLQHYAGERHYIEFQKLAMAWAAESGSNEEMGSLSAADTIAIAEEWGLSWTKEEVSKARPETPSP